MFVVNLLVSVLPIQHQSILSMNQVHVFLKLNLYYNFYNVYNDERKNDNGHHNGGDNRYTESSNIISTCTHKTTQSTHISTDEQIME